MPIFSHTPCFIASDQTYLNDGLGERGELERSRSTEVVRERLYTGEAASLVPKVDLEGGTC